MKKRGNINEFLKKRWYYVATPLILFILALFNIIPNSFAQKYVIRNVFITSENLNYEAKEGGSFQIEKSAEWTDYQKARVTFSFDTVGLYKETNQDIIFILDVSGSMNGNKLEKVKNDTSELIETLLSNPNNRASLISFSTNSSIVVKDLTNDKNLLLDSIHTLQTSGTTNYYEALKNVEEVLQEYQKEENRELTLLFLTDGFPNEDTPNEIGEYEYLKNKYPYMSINAIQYEMGKVIQEPIKKISDHQFLANIETLHNVLFEASEATISYEEFTITDYINNDYFDIESIDNIKVSTGKVELEGNKITWDLSPLRSGRSAKMTIDLAFKGEIEESGGYYPTNKKEEIKTKIRDHEEDIDTPKTPILKYNYAVTYEGNNPSCSNIAVPNPENYGVYSQVEISKEVPICEGYQFKGWEITTKNVVKMNDDYFQMPSENVIIRAVWSKLTLSKSMDGEVYEERKGSLKKITAAANTEFWQYKGKITKVIFENTIDPKETDLSWDVSVEQNGSVMSYLVRNEGTEEFYTLYLQSQDGVKANSDSSYLFYLFSNLASIEGLEYFDTSNVTNMNHMFYSCGSLTNLDLSHFDTANVTDMSNMFNYCEELVSLNLNGFNTSSVTTMWWMFYGCSKLTNVDLSSFDTSNVINMGGMFSYCSKLKNLDLSHFDTSNVTNMHQMFLSCFYLSNLNIEQFNTSNVKDMSQMFFNCLSLRSLSIVLFDFSNVTNMDGIFSNMPENVVIQVKDVDTQTLILNLSASDRPDSWSTSDIIIVS